MNGGVDFAYIRLGDVILGKPNVTLTSVHSPDARADLERVRARARKYAVNPATALPPVTANDKTALLSAIST